MSEEYMQIDDKSGILLNDIYALFINNNSNNNNGQIIKNCYNIMESKELLTKRRIETLALQHEISDSVLKSIYSKIIEDNNPKVFISHSSLEKDFAKKVLCFLYYSNGVSSYVDWQDPNLPSETNAETAEKLKKRIEKSKKII